MTPTDSSGRRWLADVPRWMFALFAAGIAVRVGLMVVYEPAALQNGDTISYLTFGPFVDSRQPSGIQLFAAPFKWIGSFPLLVLAFHAAGVLTAAVLAAAARRLGCGWIATGAVAAVALFASDVLYLEHALLTDPLFTALAASALLLALPSPCRPSLPLASALAAGLTAGASLCTRTVGVVVVGAVVVAAFSLGAGPARPRLLRATAALAGAAAVIGLYMGGVALTANGQSGIGQWGGWYTYARAAPFADCRQLTPPAGTARLCETTPADLRQGPSYYMFDPASPARLAFGGPPLHGDLLSRFGRAAIEAQPNAYAHVVLRDLIRYVDDDFGRDQPRSGGGYSTIALDRRDPTDEATVTTALSGGPFGRIATPIVHTPNLVELYAAIFAIDGRVLLLLLLLAAAAVVLVRGRRLGGVTLYSVVALALLVVPVMTIIYNARYAIPAALLLTVPAAVGAEALMRRLTRPPIEPPSTASEVSVDAATAARP